jgi:hypothetical protein
MKEAWYVNFKLQQQFLSNMWVMDIMGGGDEADV